MFSSGIRATRKVNQIKTPHVVHSQIFDPSRFANTSPQPGNQMNQIGSFPQTPGASPNHQISTLYNVTDLKSKWKTAMIDFIKNTMKMYPITQSMFLRIESALEENTLNSIMENILKFAHEITIQKEKQKERQNKISKVVSRQLTQIDQKQVNHVQNNFVIKNIEASRYRLIKQSDQHHSKKKELKGKGSKSPRTQNQEDNFNLRIQELKKQIFALRTINKGLQNKIIFLMEDYKQKKQIYLMEIKKLATICNLSIKDIRQLIFQRRQETTEKGKSTRRKATEQQDMQNFNGYTINIQQQPHLQLNQNAFRRQQRPSPTFPTYHYDSTAEYNQRFY